MNKLKNMFIQKALSQYNIRKDDLIKVKIHLLIFK